MIKKKFGRLSKENKKTIKKLTLEGKSLNKISALMNLNKNTVYYQVKKFKPKVNREIHIENISLKELGELIGAFAGDGSYYHQIYSPVKKNSMQHRIRYHLSFNDDKDYAAYLISLLNKINLYPFTIENPNKGIFNISLSSKQFIQFIKSYLIWEKHKTLSIRLQKTIKEYPNEFLIGFAKGLMDTDGYVEVSNVSCACISETLIKNLIEIFDMFEIKYKHTIKRIEGKHDLFLVRVYRESLDKYKEIIGFSNPYKLETLNKILKRI